MTLTWDNVLAYTREQAEQELDHYEDFSVDDYISECVNDRFRAPILEEKGVGICFGCTYFYETPCPLVATRLNPSLPVSTGQCPTYDLAMRLRLCGCNGFYNLVCEKGVRAAYKAAIDELTQMIAEAEIDKLIQATEHAHDLAESSNLNFKEE